MFRRFLAELKQRRVVQVAGIYAVVAWGIFQVAHPLFPTLGLPAWTVTLTAVLLMLGFPIVLVMAWALEATPEGIRVTRTSAPEGTRFAWRDWALLAAAAVVVIVAGAQMTGLLPSFGGRSPSARTAAAPPASTVPARSIAVLPFANFSSAPDSELFADGLTEEIINSLAQIEDLKVAGRTSVFYFKGRNEDLRSIGRQLGVAHVLEGSVRRDGQRLRITVQLIQVSDGFHLWSHQYDRELSDAFALQTEIANAVAQVLRARLLPAAQTAQRSGEAYQLDVTGQALLRTLGLQEIRRAREIYQRIIRLEPNNAEAHARYAMATMLLAQNYLALDFATAQRESDAAVERAIRLAPDHAAGYAARGFINNIYLVRTGEARYITEADAAFRRALAISPRNPDIETYYGNFLLRAGRAPEAIQHLDIALSTDPLNRVAQLARAAALADVGRVDDAVTQYRASISQFPDFIDARQSLGNLLVSRGRLAEAEPWLRQSAAPGTDPSAAVQLAHLYLNLGMPQDALSQLRSIREPPAAAVIAQAAQLLARADYRALLQLSESRFAQDQDPIWRSGIFIASVMLGEHDKARAQAAHLAPELFQAQPVVRTQNYLEAVAIAHVLRAQGDQAQARRVLDAVLAATAPRPGEPQSRSRRMGRLAAFAELGSNDAAIAELRAAYDDGWRTLWDIDAFTRIDTMPMFAGLRQDPRFRAIMAELDADMARQRAQVLAARRQTGAQP